MNKMRKNIVLLAVMMLTIALLSACGGSDEKDENEIEIIYQAPDDAFESWMNKVKDQFEEEYEDATVKITPIEADEGEYPNKKILMMKSEDTTPDVVMENTDNIQQDSAAEYLEPMTDDVEDWDDWDQFYDEVKEGVTGDGNDIYGVPVSTDIRGLWYNKKVFEDAGISVPWEPETWNDVLNTADKIKDDVEVPIWMNSGKAMGDGTVMQTFLPLLYGTDDKLFDDDSEEWIVESDGFKDTLDFIRDVYGNDLGASLSWGITGQAGAKVSTELMPEGEVGIALDGSWLPGNWQEDGNAPWEDWEDNIDIAPIPTQDGDDPGHVTVSGGWALSVSEKAHNKELAQKFIEMATSKDNLLYGTQLTPREDIAEMDEYNQIPYQEKMTDFLEFTNYHPANDEYPEVSSNIQAAVESVTTGDLTPEEAMEKFAEDTQRDIGEENTTTK